MSDRSGALVAAASSSGLGRSASLRAVLCDLSFAGVIAAPMVAAILGELGFGDVHSLMQQLTTVAQVEASAAISGYRAGAIALGGSGGLYLGFNIEHPGVTLGCTVHAEQTAVVNAWSNGETRLQALATSAAPCGHCRQFLCELDRGPEIAMVFPGWPRATLATLLPDSFGPQDLGVTAGLMAGEQMSLHLRTDPHDALLLATLRAAETSHAPYSHGWAAVACQTASGLICIGRYAENAALNPSLSPMASMLALLQLHGARPADIRRLVLVQVTSAVDHVASTQALLTVLPIDVELEVQTATDADGMPAAVA